MTNTSAGSSPLCPVLRDMRARGAPSASAWRHGAGAKSWALARVRQAADRGQEHRYTGCHHRRNVPRSLEGGKAPAKLGRPWAEAKWSESRLGCLADWLQASWQLGRGHPGRSSRGQVGSPWGCPSRLPCHQGGSGRQPTCHQLPALKLPHPPPPSSSSMESWSKLCHRHNMVTFGVQGEGARGS